MIIIIDFNMKAVPRKTHFKWHCADHTIYKNYHFLLKCVLKKCTETFSSFKIDTAIPQEMLLICTVNNCRLDLQSFR